LKQTKPDGVLAQKTPASYAEPEPLAFRVVRGELFVATSLYLNILFSTECSADENLLRKGRPHDRI